MGQTIKLSAVIITFNEERDIGRCLDSLDGIADDIVVVDSFSTDRTEEICRDKEVRFLQHPFKGHIEQKNYALQQAQYDHVISLDGDEALSLSLRQTIAELKHGWQYCGYSVNRLNNYCGRWIKHCGWYPDTKVRLWDRRKGGWGGRNPHDKVVLTKGCSVKHIHGDILHYSYYTTSENVAQINKFSDIAARDNMLKGRQANMVIDIILNPLFTFFKKYFLQLGFLDGYYGFIISIHSAYSRFLKYTKLRELNRKMRT